MELAFVTYKTSALGGTLLDNLESIALGNYSLETSLHSVYALLGNLPTLRHTLVLLPLLLPLPSDSDPCLNLTLAFRFQFPSTFNPHQPALHPPSVPAAPAIIVWERQ